MAASLGMRFGLGGSVLLGLTLSLTLSAADPPVELVAATREVPERGKLQAATMVQGEERSSFIVPAGWRMGLETKSGAVLLQSAEYAGLIEIRRLPISEKVVSPKDLHKQLSESASQVARQDEYAWVGTPCRSQVYDTFETLSNNLKLRRRVCFMYRTDHVLVVTLTTREDRFETCLRAYEIVLASLRQE